MNTIGFEADWTIHREGCKDATDLEIIGTFITLDGLVNNLIATEHPYADELSATELREDLKQNCLKPCTGLR